MASLGRSMDHRVLFFLVELQSNLMDESEGISCEMLEFKGFWMQLPNNRHNNYFKNQRTMLSYSMNFTWRS